MTISAAGKMVAEWALVESLIVRSWADVDRRGGAGVSGCFTEHGSLVFGAAENNGRDEIDLVYAQRRARGTRTARHVVTNVQVETRPGGWRAEYICILFAADGRPVIAGATPVAVYDVEDEVVRDGDELRLRRRTLTPIFSGGDVAVSFDRPARAGGADDPERGSHT